MALAAGDTLGPYQVISPIGAGGMGEVYRARDSRLDRDVAIKVSGEQFSDRFEREARAVAALNHPNICTLYDVGPNYLVMEYVEGESPHGPLPLEEALRVARQIADALDEAHTKGIIHRDLKPGNIKITPDGTVKVLDFGLAKIGGMPTVSSLDSPTISLAATQAGVILGTAAYMSPEQARGKAVDARTDIWAFGVVLYELLTGEHLFQGDDLTDTLAAVVRKEPDWQRVPFEVRRLLRACLEKDPKRRLRSIADAWPLLDEAPAAANTTATPARSRLNIPLAAVAAVSALVAFALAFVHFREATFEPAVVRFEIVAPPQTTLGNSPPALSPDGRTVAFVARDEGGEDRIWLRAIDSLEARPLRGTEGVRVPGAFWSPDSRFIGYFAGGVVKKIDVSGGPPVTLADLGGPAGASGGSWNNTGLILMGSAGGVLRVPQAGGTAELVTKADPPRETTHGFPHFLPDGQRFLFSTAGAVYVTSLDGTPKQKLISVSGTDATSPSTPAISRAQYAPPRHEGEPGHILYVRDATLMAQPVDPDSLDVRGDPFPVADQLNGAFGGALAFFSVSPNGILAYRTGGFSADLTLRWFDRTGKLLGGLGRAGTYTDIAVSRSGTQAAVAFVDDQSSAPDIWIADAAQGVLSRFTSSPAADLAPVWAPDDRRLAYSSLRSAGGGLQGFVQTVDGGKEEEVVKEGRIRDWSSDGRYLLYDYRDSSGLFRFWVMPLDGDRKPIAYTHDRFNLAQGQFAPGDGAAGPPRWIAYVSNETGANNVYLQSFPPTGRGVPVSTDGGTEPRWRRDGKELFYVSPSGTLMAVDVSLTPALKIGSRRELFKSPIASGGPRAFAFHYDVTPDGKRFLLIARPEQAAPAASPITVVLNWQAARRK